MPDAAKRVSAVLAYLNRFKQLSQTAAVAHNVEPHPVRPWLPRLVSLVNQRCSGSRRKNLCKPAAHHLYGTDHESGAHCPPHVDVLL